MSLPSASLHASTNAIDGVQCWLAELPREAYLGAVEMGRGFKRCKRSIERMWRRNELPAPFKLCGQHVWMVGTIIDHLEKRQAAARKSGARRAE